MKITDPRTKQIIRRPKQSFLVEIPNAQKNVSDQLISDRPDADSPPAINPLDPAAIAEFQRAAEAWNEVSQPPK